jgi:hypothetical protein
MAKQKPKGMASMSKVAKTYKKTHKTDQSHDGAHNFNAGASPTSLGTSSTKNTYQPKAKRAVFGSVTKDGKGTTKIKKAVKALKK